jgi:hypothetical protein
LPLFPLSSPALHGLTYVIARAASAFHNIIFIQYTVAEDNYHAMWCNISIIDI